MPKMLNTITDASLKKLEPIDNKQTTYSDPLRKGFVIQVSPKGGKSFSYRYTINKKARRFSLGTYPGTSLSNARTKWLEASGKVNEGKDIWLFFNDEDHKAEVTVREVFNLWFKENVERDRKHPQQVKRNCENHILKQIGDMPIIKINDIRLLNKFIFDPLKDTEAVRMPNVIFTALSQIWRYAEQKGYLGNNPYQPFNSMVRPIKSENKGTRVLNDDEIIKFWHGLNSINQMSKFTKLGLKLLLLTGVRKNELLTAEWENMDLANRTWKIKAENAKSGRDWRVALSSMAIELFDEAKDHAHHTAYLNKAVEKEAHGNPEKVFNLGRNTLDQAIYRGGYTKLKIEKFVPHDLRRTHRTLLARMGVSYHAGEKALDHTLRTGVEETYNKYDYFEERLEGAELVGEHIRGLITQPIYEEV